MIKITFTLSILFILFAQDLIGQKFLLLDNYNRKRVKLYKGDQIKFKLKGDKTKYNDYIAALQDSAIVLGTTGQTIPLTDFSKFYFIRNGMIFLSTGTMTLATGFLFASAIEPVVSNSRYDARESAIIGSSFFLASQIFRLFKWKKFNFNRGNHRIRILDTTFRNPLTNKKISSS